MKKVPVKSRRAQSKKHHGFCWGVKHMAGLRVASLLENWEHPTGNVQIPSSPGLCWINRPSCICACIEASFKHSGLCKRSLREHERQPPGAARLSS